MHTNAHISGLLVLLALTHGAFLYVWWHLQ